MYKAELVNGISKNIYSIMHSRTNMHFKRSYRLGLALITIFSCTASHSKTHQAICSYYSRYEPCTVTVARDSISANLPTDFLEVDVSNLVDIKIYKDLGKETNYVFGTATTVLFGPLGLVGFLAQKNYGTVDFGVEFTNERGKKKTAYVRFVNLRAADDFGNDLKPLLEKLAISGKTSSGNKLPPAKPTSK